ncbi:hypothetical protein FA10DRAFT_267324 [Acaromyces ingoldii]|uniref:Uncharacterized protein n=1 Tax=Acaromyces ingoldii TaxID=215250 RepID=A0A316YT35_9BASI|nr:hypothetical protein FA10DRAFT_267324 [Acaromyces ingoldii]PWN90895.1 hypothetical protein FA10DRAFT_267324 [Acaromyces ingoldii]
MCGNTYRALFGLQARKRKTARVPHQFPWASVVDLARSAPLQVASRSSQPGLTTISDLALVALTSCSLGSTLDGAVFLA